jgi:hypothetical protein
VKITLSLTAYIAAAVFSVTSAHAATIVNDAPPNGNSIDIVYSRAADAFTFSGTGLINGINFWYQTDTGDFPTDLSTVAWAIYSNASGSLGSVLASGTATPGVSFDLPNNADFATFSIPDVELGHGTYWLELHAGVSLTDTNNNLDIWWANTDLTRPLDALMDSGTNTPATPVGTPGFQTLAFQLLGAGGSVDNSVPEPSALMLVLPGLAMLLCGAGARRWRRKRIAL